MLTRALSIPNVTYFDNQPNFLLHPPTLTRKLKNASWSSVFKPIYSLWLYPHPNQTLWLYVSSAKRPCKAPPTSPVLPGGWDATWWLQRVSRLTALALTERGFLVTIANFLGIFFRHSVWEIHTWSHTIMYSNVLNYWYDWEQRIPNRSGLQDSVFVVFWTNLRWGWKRTLTEATTWTLFKERATPHRFLSSHHILQLYIFWSLRLHVTFREKSPLLLEDLGKFLQDYLLCCPCLNNPQHISSLKSNLKSQLMWWYDFISVSKITIHV